MRITLFLLRDQAPAGSAVLHAPDRFREVNLAATEGVNWQLLVSGGVAREASWVKSLRPIIEDDDELTELQTLSSSAVLLVLHAGRAFALTFGHGYHAIDAKYVERGFGLRVAANVIATNRVTSADTRGMSGTGRNQKTMLATASDLYALGIEPTEEWVRQLSGEASEKSFAAVAAGADSLQLTIKDFSLASLPQKLRDIWTRYQSDAYRAEFGFLDNFIRLDRADPAVSELDEIVEEMVLAEDAAISFAAPDPFEQLRLDHYAIKYRKEIGLDHLGREEVFDAIHRLNPGSGVLRRFKVWAYNDEDEPVDKRYDLYDYVQAEVPRADGRYVLTAGVWFRVSDDYVAQIRAYVSGIDDVTGALALPEWDTAALRADVNDKTLEGSYNRNTAADRGFALLDKDNLPIGGPNQKIEICDLLTPDRQLVCVKQATRSSTLSHLFAQGGVSASLMNDSQYRDKLMASLHKLDADAEYGTPSDWTFVYAIAIDKPGILAESLFFFSQTNLVTHARDIRSRGYHVALCRIPIV